MWRILLLSVLLIGLPASALARDMSWQACQPAAGPTGPALSDCRPIGDFIDPQGRELWIRHHRRPHRQPAAHPVCGRRRLVRGLAQ